LANFALVHGSEHRERDHPITDRFCCRTVSDVRAEALADMRQQMCRRIVVGSSDVMPMEAIDDRIPILTSKAIREPNPEERPTNLRILADRRQDQVWMTAERTRVQRGDLRSQGAGALEPSQLARGKRSERLRKPRIETEAGETHDHAKIGRLIKKAAAIIAPLVAKGSARSGQAIIVGDDCTALTYANRAIGSESKHAEAPKSTDIVGADRRSESLGTMLEHRQLHA